VDSWKRSYATVHPSKALGVEDSIAVDNAIYNVIDNIIGVLSLAVRMWMR
jgi:hypothetical protein